MKAIDAPEARLRAQSGRALRKNVARESHAELETRRSDRNPVALLDAVAATAYGRYCAFAQTYAVVSLTRIISALPPKTDE
jgi:hypothetical protein